MSTVLTRPPSPFHRSHVPHRRRGVERVRAKISSVDVDHRPLTVNPPPIVLPPRSRSSRRGVMATPSACEPDKPMSIHATRAVDAADHPDRRPLGADRQAALERPARPPTRRYRRPERLTRAPIAPNLH